MPLLQYIIVKEFRASHADARKNSLASLSADNEYVIEKHQSEVDSNGNSHYVYKIFKDQVEQPFIPVGRWKISHLHTFHQFRPYQTLLFNLIDPDGINSNDNLLPCYWINKQNVNYIHVPGTNEDAIAKMLNIAEEASKYDSWLSFIKAKFEANIKERYEIQLESLRNEVEKVNGKLNSIQSILNG